MSKVRINPTEEIIYRGSMSEVPEELMKNIIRCNFVITSKRAGYLRRRLNEGYYEVIICKYGGRYGRGYTCLYPSNSKRHVWVNYFVED